MKRKIDIIDILYIISIILLVVFIGWRILGNSPTLETIGFLLSLIFLGFTFESRRDSRLIKGRLDDIYNILKEKLR